MEMFIKPNTKVQEIRSVTPLDQEEKKLFYKEVRLLNDLQHPNIVRLKGVSFQPLAMMLEYVEKPLR